MSKYNLDNLEPVIVTDEDQLNAVIASIPGSMDAVNRRITFVGVNLMDRAVRNGDIAQLRRLLDLCTETNGFSKNQIESLYKWFTSHSSPLSLVGDVIKLDKPKCLALLGIDDSKHQITSEEYKTLALFGKNALTSYKWSAHADAITQAKKDEAKAKREAKKAEKAASAPAADSKEPVDKDAIQAAYQKGVEDARTNMQGASGVEAIVLSEREQSFLDILRDIPVEEDVKLTIHMMKLVKDPAEKAA